MGATVSGSWTGATGDSDIGITDADGCVSLTSDSAKYSNKQVSFTFTVEGVSLTGWNYAPALNAETSDTITYL